MTTYSADHAHALADIRAAGAAVTFTRTTHTTDASTALITPTTSTIAGYAVRVPGAADRYAALNLVPSNAPTLLFAASTYGDEPRMGDAVTWGSTVYVVRDVDATAPDGTTIIASIVVSGS